MSGQVGRNEQKRERGRKGGGRNRRGRGKEGRRKSFSIGMYMYNTVTMHYLGHLGHNESLEDRVQCS